MFFRLVLGRGFAVMMLVPICSPQRTAEHCYLCRNALFLGSGERLLSFQGIPVAEVPSQRLTRRCRMVAGGSRGTSRSSTVLLRCSELLGGCFRGS